MPEDRVGLFVRLGALEAQRLNEAAAACGRSKRHIVEEAVRGHLDAGEGMVVGRVALPEPAPEVMTTEEAAALLRLRLDELVAGAEAGEIPGRRIGADWRFSRARLLRWLDG